MELFDYLAIAFSLVFSFTVTRLLAGLSHATQPGRRYWVHLAFVGVALTLTAFVFWWFWSFRHISWTLAGFILVLANPALIYVVACLLIPERAASIESWRDHYYSIRHKVFVVVLCWFAVAASSTTLLLGLPLLHFARAGEAATLVFGLVGVMFENERVHAGLVICAMIFIPIVGFTLFADPDFLAR